MNDRRQYGDCVGHHGLVMEDGLPADTTLTLRRTGYVYDLVARRKLDHAFGSDETMRLDVYFGPCEGRLLMVTDRPIENARVTAPEQANPGESITIRAAVVSGDGRLIDAVVPVRVDLVDPHGRPAEWSGYYGAKDGRIEIRADLAGNDTPGLWRVSVEELASGIRHDAYVRVAP